MVRQACLDSNRSRILGRFYSLNLKVLRMFKAVVKKAGARYSLSLNPSSAIYLLCDLRQVISPLCASGYLICKMSQQYFLSRAAVGRK